MKKDKLKDLCVICGEHIEMTAVWICGQCLQPCEVDDSIIVDKVIDKTLVYTKSKCCSTDAQSVGRLTCSEKCHDTFVKMLEKEFGAVKKVTDEATGIDYSIPIKDIIERGLTWQDLPRYPQWKDPIIN